MKPANRFCFPVLLEYLQKINLAVTPREALLAVNHNTTGVVLVLRL